MPTVVSSLGGEALGYQYSSCCCLSKDRSSYAMGWACLLCILEPILQADLGHG